MNSDVIGEALRAYYSTQKKNNIEVISSVSEDDVIPVDYLFRTFDEMPTLEQKALDLCTGNVLDVGAAAGCHSLALNQRGVKTTAIDTSKGAVEVMLQQGVTAQEQDFYKVKEHYDTVLILMNGSGIAGTITNLPHFLNHAKSLLNEGGQILLDSSDIKYLYEEEDGSMWLDLNSAYYGEVTYQMKFRDLITEPFDWLFVDYNKLNDIATKCGLTCELVEQGEHYDYLARLTINK
jgi:methylase of polypeptide subunit release factors